MATQFIESYLDAARYVPTSSVRTISATTDKARIDVALVCENGIGDEMETFFETSLYAFDGVVELSDVGRLVEEYFRRRDKVADTIQITFDDVGMDILFLYSEHILPDDFDPDNTLFVASPVQRVHQDSTVVFAAVNRGSSVPCTIRAVGHNVGNDSLSVAEFSLRKPLSYDCATYFSVAEIIRIALGKTETTLSVQLRDVLYFSIEYANIQKMCFIVNDPAYLTFSFRNVFNVEEFVDIVGTVTTKTEVSRDIAVCSGHSKHYDRVVSRSYQVETAPVPSDEVPVIEQLLASHRVLMYIDNNDHGVIIEDHTCEPSSADDTLSTFKFSWHFDDRRPVDFDSEIYGIMTRHYRIFDDTFSTEYE